MLHLKNITRDTPELEEIKDLYERSFPKQERIPIDNLIDHTPALDFCGIYDDHEFCGFFSLLTNRDISHITFFAVEENLRGRGVGSKALSLICGVHPGNRVIADLEEVEEGADNNDQRIRRKGFYLRNGFEETEVVYRWRGVYYRILSHGGKITYEEFEKFWEDLERDKLV